MGDAGMRQYRSSEPLSGSRTVLAESFVRHIRHKNSIRQSRPDKSSDKQISGTRPVCFPVQVGRAIAQRTPSRATRRLYVVERVSVWRAVRTGNPESKRRGLGLGQQTLLMSVG
ncbi:hypothetical protein WG66_000212 [Moniliophthora roreri]|nr:hypothetical protein WG66_000212 [Moniliophthora roreri]